VKDGDGRAWPLLRPPFRFPRTQFVPPTPIGALGEANAALFAKQAFSSDL